MASEHVRQIPEFGEQVNVGPCRYCGQRVWHTVGGPHEHITERGPIHKRICLDHERADQRRSDGGPR